MQDSFSADQTNFSAQEPLYESASFPEKPIVPSEEAALEKPKKFYHSNMFKIGSISVAILVVAVLLVVAINSNSRGNDLVAEPSVAPTAKPVSNDPLQRRIDTLAQQLQLADPSDDPLPLPPVDLLLSLED